MKMNLQFFADRESTSIFPEVINNFKVYDGGDAYQGTAGEISLAEFSSMTATVSGAGILGEYNTAVIGMFSSITQQIPFRIINREFFSLMDATKQAELVLRASIQNVDRQTGGTLSTQGMRIVFRGRPTAVSPGTLKQGDLMNASVTLELTYVLIEIGGESKLELDKLNSIYKINGKDLLADIRRQC